MNDAESARRAEMEAWIEGGAFVRDGKPVTFYHGTECEDPFNVFTRCDEASIGFHFGDHRVATDRLRVIHRMDQDADRLGVIIPVICRATNPIELRDHFMWDMDSVAGELEDLDLINGDQAEAILDSCDEAYLFAAIELAGHDCITYRNECEFKDESTISLLVWRAEHLKSPFAASFDREDPRLMPQIGTDEGDLLSWRSLAERIEAAKVELANLRQPAMVI